MSESPFLSSLSLRESVIYRNPKPHVHSIQAYFPSVVAFDDRHLGATVVLGEAFEAPNLHLVYFESRDAGATWNRLSNVTRPDPAQASSSTGRLTLLAGGELLVVVTRNERHPDDNGITEGASIGMRPMGVELYRSRDQGVSWSGPELVKAPLADTAFEICSPVEVLADGTLVWPTSTWPLAGREIRPDGFRTGMFVSRDGGRSWPEWIPTFPNDACVYWESKMAFLPDGRLLSVAWAHELEAGTDRPVQFVIGTADASEWRAPQSTGILGQTTSVGILPGGNILSVYRRMDQPGLWATLSRLEDGAWQNLESRALWLGTDRASDDQGRIREHFATLKFGAPSLALFPDGKIFVAFWCVVDGVSQIGTVTLSEHASV